MRWQSAEAGQGGSQKIPDTWLHNHYYEALTVLFRIENSLRAFVFVVLKNCKGKEWSSLSLKTEEGAETTIGAVAKRRLNQDKAFGYLGYTISSPLMHLTSGELIRIVLSESYWPWFAAHFPASKAIVQNKLEEIGNVRNAMAHFRPLTTDDVEVVKQNANQVLSGVEALLSRVIECEDTVPTNSSATWYRELRALAGPQVQLAFSQTDNEEWIRIGVGYSCPILTTHPSSQTYQSYRVLSLNTAKILKATAPILDRIVFASEEVPYVVVPPQGDPPLQKIIRLMFSREALEAGLSEIKESLQKIMQQIAEETDLIKEDGLARGAFVQALYVAARRDAADKPWNIDTEQLQSAPREDDPAELWLNHPYFGANFVSHSHRFPWMPVAVSKFTLPW